MREGTAVDATGEFLLIHLPLKKEAGRTLEKLSYRLVKGI
jgi:hypothetical protein